jgi:acylphosphatase
VQGVGFRFRTLAIARRHKVAGYVRNLPDGSVRIVAEGSRGELDRFLAEVAEAMSGYIRRCRTENSIAVGEFGGFVVRG